MLPDCCRLTPCPVVFGSSSWPRPRGEKSGEGHVHYHSASMQNEVIILVKQQLISTKYQLINWLITSLGPYQVHFRAELDLCTIRSNLVRAVMKYTNYEDSHEPEFSDKTLKHARLSTSWRNAHHARKSQSTVVPRLVS